MVYRYLMDTMFNLRLAGGADAYLSKCPSRTVLVMLSDKWTLLMLCALSTGPRRFGELHRRLDGITHKMLSQTLRTLERDGLVTRTVYATVPPSVEYALTDLGMSATNLVEEVRQWAEIHVDDVLESRVKYDDREKLGPLQVK